jgi:hypothetical protein
MCPVHLGKQTNRLSCRSQPETLSDTRVVGVSRRGRSMWLHDQCATFSDRARKVLLNFAHFHGCNRRYEDPPA